MLCVKNVFNIRFSLHAALPSKVIDKCKKKGLERRLSFTPKRYTISFQNGSRQNRIWNVERERQLKTLYSNDCTLIREAVILTPFWQDVVKFIFNLFDVAFQIYRNSCKKRIAWNILHWNFVIFNQQRHVSDMELTENLHPERLHNQLRM